MSKDKKVYMLENRDDGLVGIYTSMKKVHDRIMDKVVSIEENWNDKARITMEVIDGEGFDARHKTKVYNYAKLREALARNIWVPIFIELDFVKTCIHLDITSVILDR